MSLQTCQTHRNVFLLQDPNTQLGGLFAAPSTTNADCYSMADILITSRPYTLQDEHNETLPRNNQPLLPGRNTVVSPTGSISTTNERFFLRTASTASGPRVTSFTDQVRARDRRCVVSKRENAMAPFGRWDGFEAAHIFPLAYEEALASPRLRPPHHDGSPSPGRQDQLCAERALPLDGSPANV